MKDCISSNKLLCDVSGIARVIYVEPSTTTVEVDVAVVSAVVLDAARENPDVYVDCVIREKQPYSRFRFVFKNRVLICESLHQSNRLNCLLFRVVSVSSDSNGKRRCKKYVKEE